MHHLGKSACAGLLCLLSLAVSPLGGSAGGSAQADEGETHLDLELRAGAGVLCAWCIYEREYPGTIDPTAQVFIDVLFPVSHIGPIQFHIGPYIRAALLDHFEVPQGAAGLAMSYQWGPVELIGTVGMGYATERIGEVPNVRSGQTKHTYDLGTGLRYHFDEFFVSAGYQHNSNGDFIGLNFLDGKGENPGYDQVYVGVGIRF